MTDFKDNKIAYIDLTLKKIKTETISQELRKKYIGGTGINTKLLHDLIDPKVDPLSKNNILIFGCGIIVGTHLFAGNRCTVTSKSPLSNIFGDSNFGGNFAPYLRASKYDHLVFQGKSVEPVYLYIEEGKQIEIKNATDLWGCNTVELGKILEKRHGNKCEIACIGKAGEHLNKFANIIVSNTHAAGRTGMGCVMGSKNLKAIVVKPAKLSVPIFDRDQFKQLREKYINMFKDSPVAHFFSEYGTTMLVDLYNEFSALPNYNGQKMKTDKIKQISCETFKNEYQTDRIGCHSCPVACVKKYKIKTGKYTGETGEKIDFGSIAALGPNLGVYDYGAILHFENLANDYGMDTMELGAVISMAMECYQRGIISTIHTKGLELEWGNIDIIETLITLIGENKGFGKILNSGTKNAAQAICGEKYSFTIKGIAVSTPARDRKAWSLGYITSTRGGDHLKSFPFSMMYGPSSETIASKIFKTNTPHDFDSSSKKGRIVWWHENYKLVIDSFGFCILAISPLALSGAPFYKDFSDIMKSVLGIDMNDKEIFYAAERIFQLQKIFNIMNSQSKKDDEWPIRAKDDDVAKDIIDEATIDKNEQGMIDEYYKYRGLTLDGFPTVNRLSELGLNHQAESVMDCIKDDDNIHPISELLNTININV
ncbi:MAG: aldehyde ferredoxin oxidoreductase family protein [Proteobacteria bacterium]|nr:aldehyde ferredoxin oxidoreductase family protein [Pseudomonadota bacterium]MBU1585640.1 aldehyde ferredoxin oxidoreductase family protein [Pseudomonadota bacterium]MBU2629638.1 aldehyde ferredoxin oxidoreductase family protein [Pseudomonadota bacterium]